MATVRGDRRLLNISLHKDQHARLEAWREKQPAVPSITAVIEAALSEFLEKYDDSDPR
jgi:hypothetical protein